MIWPSFFAGAILGLLVGHVLSLVILAKYIHEEFFGKEVFYGKE